MARVEMYATATCPYCFAARRLLSDRSIPFDDIDVGGDAARREEMMARAGGRHTVPQVFIDGAHVGGYEELQALADAGGLEHLP